MVKAVNCVICLKHKEDREKDQHTQVAGTFSVLKKHLPSVWCVWRVSPLLG